MSEPDDTAETTEQGEKKETPGPGKPAGGVVLLATLAGGGLAALFYFHEGMEPWEAAIFGAVAALSVWGWLTGRESSAKTSRPIRRTIKTPAESEELAAEFVRTMGWRRAKRTSATGDGGIDVIGSSNEHGTVVAQVKFEQKKTGRPALQGLYGAGHGVGAQHWLFFSHAGYSPMALEWGDHMRIGLFTFDEKGSVRAAKGAARRYLRPAP